MLTYEELSKRNELLDNLNEKIRKLALKFGEQQRNNNPKVSGTYEELKNLIEKRTRLHVDFICSSTEFICNTVITDITNPQSMRIDELGDILTNYTILERTISRILDLTDNIDNQNFQSIYLPTYELVVSNIRKVQSVYQKKLISLTPKELDDMISAELSLK